MPPLSAPDHATLQTTRHLTVPGLNVYAPPTIWTAQVNGAQAQGAGSIAVDNVVSTRTPSRNFQVWIGTTPGANDLGETRWRSYGAPTLVVAPHAATLPDDAYITVKDWVPAVSTPLGIVYGIGFALDTYYEDGDIPYTNDNTLYPPLAHCGTHAVIKIDPNTGVATGKFYDHGSIAVAPAATIASVLWSWRGGTVTAGGTTNPGTALAPNTVTWNTPGDYHCSYTVTDSNGKTHTRWFVIFVRDPANDILTYRELNLSPIEGDASGVFHIDLTVFTTADSTNFPRNALCVLAADDYYDDQPGAIGIELYRENILLAGYIRSDSVKRDWQKGTVAFAVDNLAGVLQNEGQFGGDLETSGLTPAGEPPWHILTGLTYNLAVHHVLVWHSTASQLGDVYLNLDNKTAEFVTLAEGTLADQLTPICDTVSGHWGSNPMGHLYFEPHPQLTDLAGRSTAYVIDADLADIRDIDFGTESQEKKVSRIDFWAEDANGDPFGSWAPNTIGWPTGVPEQMENGIRCVDQADCNRLAGLYEAYHNLSFKEVIVNWRGNYRIFGIFPAEPIALSAPTNPRGIAWSHQRCWVTHVTLDLQQPGICLVSTTVEMDVGGGPGITQPEDSLYPTIIPPPPVPPPIPPIPPITPIPFITPGDVPGKGNRVFVSTHKGLAMGVDLYGTNGLDGSPVWSSMNGSGGGALSDVVIRWFNLDPASVSGDHFTACWVMTDTGLFRGTGIPTPSWALQLTAADANTLAGDPASAISATRPPKLTYNFTPSVRLAGFIAVQLNIYSNGGTWQGVGVPGNGVISFIVYSLDYGATWHVDNTKWISYPGILLNNTLYPEMWTLASYHKDNLYYAGINDSLRAPIGSEAGIPMASPNATYMISNGFPKMSPGMAVDYNTGHYFGRIHIPYCDPSGNVYADDKRAYIYAGSGGYSGSHAIHRYNSAFSPLWSGGYTPPVSVAIANAGMPSINWLFANMFNEDAAAAIGADGSIWLCPNISQASPTWTNKGLPVIGGRSMGVRYPFCVPADKNIIYFCANAGSGGVGGVFHTVDFGANFVGDDLNTAAGSLSTVMGLGAGDMDESEILVDYYKT